MKKHIFLVLMAALSLLLSMTALADASGRGGLVARDESLAAYVDGYGNLKIPGSDQPVNLLPADTVISIDPYRLIFMSKSEIGGLEKTALVCVDLTSFEETVIHDDVHAACMADSDRLYFIPASDRTQLYLADFEYDIVKAVYTSVEPLDGLYASAEGLVATCVEDAGAVIYVEATGSFEPFGSPIPSDTVMTDGYQVYIADGDVLYLHRPDSPAADTVDVNVYDFALLNGKIYYLANTGSAVRLKAYDPELLEQKVVVTPGFSLENTLTASERGLFALGTDSVIYRVNPEAGQLESFAAIQPPVLDETVQVESYSIEAMSGMLNVYANLVEASDAPEFTFMEFASDISGSSAAKPALVQSIPLEGEETAWNLLQPARQYSPLSRGSRGDAVSTIQQPLYDHGYYNYYIDGIFGYRTDNAVRLLQGDLEMTVNGIADENLQRVILSGNFPDYDPYLPLKRGDKGLRVIAMQQRLRSLGYLADAADGIYGSRTQGAVWLFQERNDLELKDEASRETLMKLYSGSAARCSSYIDLYSGDSGYRVRELNKRLKELFYLDGSITDNYTNKTSEAVRRFQAQVGLVIDGNASTYMQQKLFASGAPECSGYSELSRGDENTRVARLQRRLKELNYFSGNVTGYFGKQTQNAVKLFQQKVGMRPTGVASVSLQELLFSPDAPKYVKPTILGTPVIDVDAFDKREGSVYYVSDVSSESGYITFSWNAEGDVDSYDVVIADEKGKVYLSQNTALTMTSVPVSTLMMDCVYTLKVTANPADGDASHITSALLSFCRVEPPKEPVEIGTIIGVHTSIEPVIRMENDIYYVKPGEVTFRWYAEGDLASYYVEIHDSRSTRLEVATLDEQASISTEQMVEGEVYTLCVYAIPVNGTIKHATLETQSFALETQPQQIPSVSAPEIMVENAAIDDTGVYVVEGDEITLRWNAVENAAQYYIEVRDAGNAFHTGDTTTATGYVLNTSALAAGSSYTVYVTAIPEGGSIETEATASVRIAIEQDEPVIQLPAPTLSAAGVQPSEDGIVYIGEKAVTFQWTAVEGASAYNVVIRDSNGAILSETTVTELSYGYDASVLTEDAVYTVSVIAVAAEGVNAQATAAALPFIIHIEEKPAEPSIEDIPSAPIELGAPEITVGTIDEILNAVVYVQEGVINFNWTCEGAEYGYYAEVLDPLKVVCTSMRTEGTTASLHSNNLTPESIYTLRVVALPESGKIEEGVESAVQFAVHASIPEDIIEMESEQTEVCVASDDVIEEQTGVEIAKISEPAIDVQPAFEIVDSIVQVQGETVTFTWSVEGAVSGYRLEILQDDVAINATNTIETSVSLGTGGMVPGSVYTFKVTAIPENGTLADGASGEVKLVLVQKPAVDEQTEASTETAVGPEAVEEATAVPTAAPAAETTAVPAEVPTPVPTEEPTPVPTKEPTPVPTEEPTPVPTEEPTPVPTEEPTPVPTEESVPEPTAEDSYMLDDEAWQLPLDPAVSDPVRVAALQEKLVELGWLLPETFEIGILDNATLLAVQNFQMDYNALQGGTLAVITPEAPVIDADTLIILMVPQE